MFEIGKASPECLIRLINACSKKRDWMEAPAWKEYIDVSVQTPWMSLQPAVSELLLAEESTSYGQEKSLNMDFPFGIYFGSRIKNVQDGRVGVVIDVHIDTILIAFEGEGSPDMILADKESFEQGRFAVA